jgi:hypothetical protein
MLRILSKIFRYILLNVSPEEEDIYNELETTYMASILKKKANNGPGFLIPAHEKAKRTLYILTKNMIAGDVPLDYIVSSY